MAGLQRALVNKGRKRDHYLVGEVLKKEENNVIKTTSCVALDEGPYVACQFLKKNKKKMSPVANMPMSNIQVGNTSEMKK